MPTQKLTNTIIEAAIDGLEARKTGIDAQIAELRAMLTGTPESQNSEPAESKSKKKKFSAATLQRMKEAQQRRWAKVKGETAVPEVAASASKPKRRLSAAGKANIIAAIKKRWAAKRAAEAAGKKPARKKAA